MRIDNLLGNPVSFVTQVIDALVSEGIDVSELELDHVCYRVKTQTEYEHYQTELAKLGTLLTEAPIGGRPISTYKLEKPIKVDNREIYLVELPAPHPDKPHSMGLEHAEFVIGDISFEEFMNQYRGKWFDISKVAKPINPDIKLKYNDLTVKFHQHSLEYVIKHEQ